MKILLLTLSLATFTTRASYADKILGRVISIPDRITLEERFKNEGLATFAQKDAVIKSLIAHKECDLYRLGSKIDISAKTTNYAIIDKILKCLLPGDNSAIQVVKQWIAELNFHEIKT